jgi:AbiV family abortive infection protein
LAVVTKEFLLRGAAYALENSGVLLRDAVTLFDQGSFASAVVMALFGREELGKYRLLRQLYETVAAGGTVPIEELTKKNGPLFDHTAKQEQATLSIVRRPEPGTRLDHLLREEMRLDLRSPERRKVDEELQQITAKLAKALPRQRHDIRMAKLYVGLSKDGSTWVRPSEPTADEVRPEVEDAIANFNTVVLRLQDGPDKQDWTFPAAFRGWADRPQILPIDRLPRLGA